MKKRVPQIFAALVLFCTVSASAQTKGAKKAAAAPVQTKQAAQTDDLQQFRQNFIKAAEDYRASLQLLKTPYESDLQKAKDQQEKLKSLYTDGLISRVEFEASGKAITDAQAKLDDLQKQLAQADESIAAASKPVETPAFGGATVARADIAWSTGSAKVDGFIRLYSKRYNVDPYLVFCVMHQESGFGAGATSPVGAMGLMQLMPGTAARYGVTNPYDPAQNIMGGAHYLSDLLKIFGGRVDLALAGYNAGEGAVMKYGNRIPPYAETQNYVRTIGTRYAQSGVSLTAKTSARAPQSKSK
ncbi:MAG TPA: transglycosylase SLT domain-containing protein [Pyrinomonadaceae bacterium]|nr:transglycosylase SLT domain-containing protein [Pyrinomonadaceae bacterium]